MDRQSKWQVDHDSMMEDLRTKDKEQKRKTETFKPSISPMSRLILQQREAINRSHFEIRKVNNAN